MKTYYALVGFPGGAVVKNRRHKRRRYDPWVGKIPWRRKWQPISVSLPGKFYEQRSLVGYNLWGPIPKNGTRQSIHTHTHAHTHTVHSALKSLFQLPFFITPFPFPLNSVLSFQLTSGFTQWHFCCIR